MNRPQKNNNPFAIMDTTPDRWKGLVSTSADGFLKFDNARNGARAGFINLINAYLKRGLNTIEKIFPVYAPTGHGANVPEDYIKRVVQLTGIPRNKVITSKDEIYLIGKAIVTHEEGIFWMNQKDFESGFNEAIEKTKSLLDSIFEYAERGSPIIIILILFVVLLYAN